MENALSTMIMPQLRPPATSEARSNCCGGQADVSLDSDESTVR